MSAIILAARLLLAAVFLVAAIAKLVDPARTRQTMRDFGVPTRAAPLAVGGVVVAEMLIAVLLLFARTAWIGDAAALALLAIFSIVISVQLLRGRTPECRCFGQIAAGPIGWRSLLRNAILAALAVLILLQGREKTGPSAVAWVTRLSTGEMLATTFGLLALLIASVGTWLLTQLLSQNGRLLTRFEALEASVNAQHYLGAARSELMDEPFRSELEAGSGTGLRIGDPVPEFRLTTAQHAPVSLSELTASSLPVILVFTDQACSMCRALVPDLERWWRELAGRVVVVAVERTGDAGSSVNPDGGAGANNASDFVLPNLLFDANGRVADAFQVRGTPSAVMVRPDGRVGSALAQGLTEIRSLVAQVSGVVGGRRSSAKGTLAVEIPSKDWILTDLNGNAVDLRTLLTRDSVLLFWNCACSYCRDMLVDLRHWDSTRKADAPQLIIIGTGQDVDYRGLGVKAQILLEPQFRTGYLFGATGTPSAVRFDTGGRWMSDVAIGAPSVLALLYAPATGENFPSVSDTEGKLE